MLTSESSSAVEAATWNTVSSHERRDQIVKPTSVDCQENGRQLQNLFQLPTAELSDSLVGTEGSKTPVSREATGSVFFFIKMEIADSVLPSLVWIHIASRGLREIPCPLKCLCKVFVPFWLCPCSKKTHWGHLYPLWRIQERDIWPPKGQGTSLSPSPCTMLRGGTFHGGGGWPGPYLVDGWQGVASMRGEVNQRSHQAWTTVCSNTTSRLFQRQPSKERFLLPGSVEVRRWCRLERRIPNLVSRCPQQRRAACTCQRVSLCLLALLHVSLPVGQCWTTCEWQNVAAFRRNWCELQATKIWRCSVLWKRFKNSNTRIVGCFLIPSFLRVFFFRTNKNTQERGVRSGFANLEEDKKLTLLHLSLQNGWWNPDPCLWPEIEMKKSVFSRFFPLIAAVWWPQVLVWLGIFWLFRETNISGKNKMFPTNPTDCRMFPQIYPPGIHTFSVASGCVLPMHSCEKLMTWNLCCLAKERGLFVHENWEITKRITATCPTTKSASRLAKNT